MAGIRPDLAPAADEIGRLRAVAAGRERGDLAFRGGAVAFVHTGESAIADVVVAGRHIAAVAPPAALPSAEVEVDATGYHVLPGFCDAHIHIEYTLLPPGELARLVTPKGTTALFADPDCSANVFGVRGINALLDSRSPLRLFLQTTSRAPRFPHLEEGGEALSEQAILALTADPRTTSYGETNPFEDTPEMNRAFAATLAAGRRVNGHTARLDGPPLWSYLAAGVSDDHNAATVEEAMERLRRGVGVALQSSSMSNYIGEVLARPEDLSLAAAHVMFSADDKYADDLASEGHIDHHLRSAVALGVPPIIAVRMATLNAAAHFHVDHLIGAVAPSRLADLVLVPDLTSFRPEAVWVGGRKVVDGGGALFANPDVPYPDWVMHTIRIGRTLAAADLAVEVPSPGRHPVRVMEMYDGYYNRSIVEKLTATPAGTLMADPTRDIAKVAVIDRHKGTGQIGRAFVRGFGLKAGAIAVSTNCESQNVVVVGVADAECAAAVNALAEMGGGLVVVSGGRVLSGVALPYGGMMTVEPYERLLQDLAATKRAAAALGCFLSSPFMVLSFVGLASVPELGLTERGLVDVATQRFVAPVLDDEAGPLVDKASDREGVP